MHRLFKETLLTCCLLLPLGLHAEANEADQAHPQIVHVDPESGRNLTDLAIEYVKHRQNAVAVMIWDGHSDEITGQRIAERLIEWFRDGYGIRVMCFVDSPENVRYSGVRYIVGDIPYGPWNLKETRERLDDIAAAYHANIQIRAENESDGLNQKP